MFCSPTEEGRRRAIRPPLVNDNAPVISFLQITMIEVISFLEITMIEVSPSSCWVVQSHEMFIQHAALCHSCWLVQSHEMFIQHAPLMPLLICCSMLIL